MSKMEVTIPNKFSASFLAQEEITGRTNISTNYDFKTVHPYSVGFNYSKHNFGHLFKHDTDLDSLKNQFSSSFGNARPLLFSDSVGLAPYVPLRKRRENKPRRQRTTFSSDQTLKLEMEYRRAEYVTRTRRLELADDLNLTETQIKIWYQNRRAKDKRIEKAHIDQHIRSMGLNNIPVSLPYTALQSSTLPPIYGWDPWILRDQLRPNITNI